MKAKELAELLLQHPDAKVIVCDEEMFLVNASKVTVYEKDEMIKEGDGSTKSEDLTSLGIYDYPICNTQVIFIS